MQVSGKLLVLATFAIGVALAGGAWWYNYQQSCRSAAFWGGRNAALLVGSSQVEFVTLGNADTDGDSNAIIGRAATDRVDLSNKPGLVHLRHALTYDATFDWASQRLEPIAARPWRYALEFRKADDSLIVLFTPDFETLGRVEHKGETVVALPCPRLGPVAIEYLGKVGVKLGD